MEVPERPSFAEFASSKEVKENSSALSKGSIAVSTLVAMFIVFFRDWGFGIWWVLVIPALWFAVSLLVAMPFQLLRLHWAYQNWSNHGRARLGTAILDIMLYVALVPAVYFGLRYFAQLIDG